MAEQLEAATDREHRHAVRDRRAQRGDLRDQGLRDQGLIPILPAADQDDIGGGRVKVLTEPQRRDLHGQGLGQEALRLLITLGFEALDLHKLWMMHFASNHRMQHLCTKLGFVNEGVLRDEYFHQDGWHDMVRGSLLRADYDAAAWRTG